MEIQALYDFAQQNNVKVRNFSLPEFGSLSVQADNGDCYIGIDKAIQVDSTQERVHLAHELGHCATGSFYSIHTAVDCRQRNENRADKWAVKKLIPVDQLDDAIAHGCTEIWELAERFGVTEEFMKKAVCYYVNGNLATALYF